MSDGSELRLVVQDDDDLEAAKSVAWNVSGLAVEAEGDSAAGEYETQFEPVTILIVAGAAVIVGKFILDWWEKRKGGLVLDQRPDKVEIRRDAEVPWGYVIIYPTDGGALRVETKDMPKDSVQQLIESVVSGTLKNYSGISDVVKKTLGGSAIKA